MRVVGTIIAVLLIFGLGVFIFKNVKSIIAEVKRRKSQKLDKKE